jgi:hypothetical protein
MKFSQFLLEQELTDAMQLIKQNCQPFLTLSNGKPLYRSVTRPIEEISIIPHPKNRRPRDSSPEFSFAFNCAIDSAFGVSDIRQRSFFATGSVAEASKYATNLAFCFPCGNFEWAWSPKIQDSYVGVDGGLEFLAQTILDFWPTRKPKFSTLELIDFFENLFAAIGSVSSSNWVHNLDGMAEQYTETAARNCSDRNILKMKHADLIHAMKRFALDYYKNNESLPDAIRSRNEIFFYDSDGYILVPFSNIHPESARNPVPVSLAYSSFLDKLK